MKNKVAKKLKQVPVGYLAIGVDPHKKVHAAVAITEDLTVRTKFKFNNSICLLTGEGNSLRPRPAGR